MEFEEWMRELDNTLDRNIGIVSDDLPDQPYRDWFEEGLTPGRAAYRALRHSGFFEEVM